jgi:hypothetical protein
MNQQIQLDKSTAKPGQWKFLGFLLWLLLTGCDWDSTKKNKPPINLDHGKRVEINGEKFRIIYIGGVRFRFPDNDTFVWASQVGDININLYWPNIPPGKAPGTKSFRWLEDKSERTNAVNVIVRETSEPIEFDKSKTLEQQFNLSPSDYIIRDDLTLGLRTFVSKIASQKLIDNGYFDYAYSLTDDAQTPWGHQPVMVFGESISFMYTPQVRVRITMMGWNDHINPNWKGIYLGVIETLNKYREDK